jgi:glucose-6-phosphate 1-dehydrogenase
VAAQRIHQLGLLPHRRTSIPGTKEHRLCLAEAGLVERSRIIMEKPFGTDLASAVSLNARLHEFFAEGQIFRIDHFLGKEAVQNILAFRFANGLFEPIWNRNFIDHVQIDVPETLGLSMPRRSWTGAFREPPKSMLPAGSGVGAQGPDHLTFDLADASKMSLSFYGKRPGPGMRLDKPSMQFAVHDTGWIGDVLETYEP